MMVRIFQEKDSFLLLKYAIVLSFGFQITYALFCNPKYLSNCGR